MSSQASIVRPVGAVGVVLALVPPSLMVAATVALWGSDRGVMAGLVVYLIYRLLIVRRVVCRDHRLGVVLTRRGRFEDAIAAFRRSQAFWAKHSTLDRWRALVLGSATRHPFHILALYNEAYCLTRVGRGAEASELVERVLALAPDMVPARELRDVMAAGRGLANAPPRRGT